ncbi:gamma-aminobutyric acid receptor subunit pi-like, partial [Penaeus japonicus]|uniref:gamma-aminobutyric acid receptor subunit pi-like n=1 Tax=Penaeus japonicus TaxID=27405 RepID=UPI001C717232
MYSGEAAIFVQQQHYSGSFACSFDVFHYPFDVQVCKVLVQLSSVREEVVRFSQERAKVVYLEDVNLPSYIVTRYEAFVTTRGTEKTKYSVVEVEFELTRRWTVIVLSVYFPTSLLLIVGYATLFVSVAQLE